MEFCSPFDEALAVGDLAAIFLPDREGRLRFDIDRTRDAWGRAPGPHAPGRVWLLLRDRDTGVVSLALVTSPDLLRQHPRADIRAYATEAEAVAAWETFGKPRLDRTPWG